ncbi:hypothetical protein H6G00_00880 [Leptolyngbya sp. FACHB-541]|uniref:hypothetical protein n=1 Tax=Leptolyngbya sp. FACHB-541 TaxID=2692810 RepID=UPI001685E3AC|nr:hypothetical protein [Leptolyngbya sp. FACHB-541]MBD1995182.1 hypothetical protein [Leptolyngbya sp. FACHB-541]
MEPTPPEPNFTPELDQLDLGELDTFRVARYQAEFPKVLGGCSLFLSGLDRGLIVIFSAEFRAVIEANLVDLRLQAWYICAASSIAFYCENDLIYSAATRLPELVLQDPLKLEIKSLELVNMATATLQDQQAIAPAPSNTSKTVQSAIPLTIPTLKTLAPYAERSHQPLEQIAAQIQSLGQLVAFDPDTGSYKATEEAIAAWVDYWVQTQTQQIIAQQKAMLMGLGETAAPIATNGKVETPPELQAEETETASPKRGRRRGVPRFKNFQKANSRNRTIGKFLEAQGWDDGKRIEMVEQISELPLEPPSEDSELSYAEHCLEKILNTYSTKPTPKMRAEFISTAKEMQGKEEVKVQEAIAS